MLGVQDVVTTLGHINMYFILLMWNRIGKSIYKCPLPKCFLDGLCGAEWLSSWLADQEDRGSIPGLATWIFRDWLSPASKSRYDWKITKSTLILKTTNQPIDGLCSNALKQKVKGTVWHNLVLNDDQRTFPCVNHFFNWRVFFSNDAIPWRVRSSCKSALIIRTLLVWQTCYSTYFYYLVTSIHEDE